MNSPAPAPELPAQEVMAPINQRWPQILRYPMQLGALSTCAAIAVAHLVTLLPVGFILDLLVWAAFFKYALEVLRWSANGRTQAPEIAFTVSDSVGRYAMLLLVLSQVALIMVLMFYGPLPTLILGIVLMIGMPAMMMILSLDEGMARALNPIAWLMLAERIGVQYLLLVGFFVVAIVLQSVVAYALSPILPSFFSTPLISFVVNYLMIVNFHLIGSVIHEHAEDLGYAGHMELKDDVPHTDPSRKILDSARNRAATGDVRGAIQLLREELGTHPELLMLHDEYRHWLQQDGDKAELVAHGKIYIPALLAQGQERRAIEVMRANLVADPAFTLDQPEQITQLAHAAAEAGQTQLTLNLLAGFHKRFRNNPDIGRNYLLAAKLWAERMNKEMQARAMLQQIKIMLPNDPIMPQVDAYLAYLDKLAATPARSSGK